VAVFLYALSRSPSFSMEPMAKRVPAATPAE
jgi:hypothetical protein